MKLKQTLSALAVASAFLAGSAQAAPFVMDVSAFGSTGAGDANTTTSLITSFALNWTATSVYTDNLLNPFGNVGTLGVGDFVFDSGAGSVGLLNGNTTITGTSNHEGINDNYSLSFRYANLPGVVSVVLDPGATPSQIAAIYSSGTIEMFAHLLDSNGDPVGAEQKMLELAVTGSTGTVGNFTLLTQLVDIAPSFLFLADGGFDFDDLLAINVIGGVTNFNNPPVAVVDNGGAPQQWQRTTDLSGDLTFSVPEPGVMALLGLGFLGMGAARRFKKSV